MAFPKPTPAAKAAFDALVPDDPRVRVKPMFGNLAAFVNDQMFMGVFANQVFLRLSEPDRRALTAATGATVFEPMPGRPMKEYLALPEAWSDSPESAREWVERSLQWAGELPPKAPKTKAAKPR